MPMQLKLFNTLVHSLSFCELSVQDITYASAVDVSSVLVYCYHPLPYRSSLTLYQWTWHGGLNLSWSWMIWNLQFEVIMFYIVDIVMNFHNYLDW